MTDTRGARIAIYGEPASELGPFLEQAGYRVARGTLPEPAAEAGGPHLIIIESSGHDRRPLQLCRQLRAACAEHFIPILFVLDDPGPAWRLASLEAGADTYLLRPFAPAELLGQVEAFLRLKAMHDRLAETTAEVRCVHERLQQTYRQIDAELDLARRIQRNFLPQTMPEVPAARFAVEYHPCERVGGDFYDVFRLDEEHVGFYVADAMGHGMPASLLTIFIKKGVRAKEIIGSQYRLVQPSEVLRQLNRDMIDQELAETPFITMVYGLLDCRTRRLTLARAGHPYPVYMPASRPPVALQIPGSLLGVFETEFPTQEHVLAPGDRVLLYTDGLFAPDAEGNGDAQAAVLRCAAAHAGLPLDQMLRRIVEAGQAQAGMKDDITALALEVR